ncbi:MAG: hypothetical protein HY926_01515 [Elusimicrobia bacterium]|nr:hypothetical protein [Elusimicrobiota bacterium]
MARVSPVVTFLVVAALCGLAVFAGPHEPSDPPEPISGVLFSVRKATCAPAGASPAKAAAPALPASPARAKALPRKAARTAEPVRAMAEAAPAALVDLSSAPAAPAAAPVALAVAPAAATPMPAAKPTSKPEPAGPVAFGDLDEALRQSPTTQALNLRVKKGGMVFRITHVGRARGRAAARFALANEEAADFFLSVVSVSAGGAPVLADTAGPYVCRAGEEIYGVVHLAPEAASGKRLSVTLVQSGGERRRFQLALEYPF